MGGGDAIIELDIRFEVYVMKLKGFFAIIVTFCLFLTGCSNSFNWDKSISKLEEAGYVIVNASSDNLEDASKSVNADIKLDGGDFTVELVRYASMVKDNDYDFQCILFQFASNDQATKYYDLRIEKRMENSKNKFYISTDVVVLADNQEVISILGYDFK